MSNLVSATLSSSSSILVLLLASLVLLLLARNHHAFLPLTTLLALLIILHRRRRSRPLYLLNFSCLRPPSHLRVPTSSLLEHLALLPCFDHESVAFMSKIITSSGLGDETYFPASLRSLPPLTHFHSCIEEAHLLLFPVLEDLFSKTHVSPSQIDVLVVNCSGFCPSPSLTSIVVNHFHMREDVKTFNLSGMGCSAGVISLDVARSVLSTRPNSYAVILSTEILSTGWYSGRDRRKLLLNCVFRMGSAAALLTNRPDERRRCKYKLTRLVRTQRAYDDAAHRSALREEDAKGMTGFSIERDLLRVAREVLRANVRALGAWVLPLRERARYVLFQLRKAAARKGDGGDEATYVPDFHMAVQHFCVPASGMALIREVGRGLGLRERDVEPAVATFQRFGNQSAASLWYQLAYVEARGRIGVGERVWQLGAGSGPKCNSAVWECVRGVEAEEEEVGGPWAGCLDRYPMSKEEVEQQRQKQQRV